jgi:type II secretory pathway predicted ATPase ExeA
MGEAAMYHAHWGLNATPFGSGASTARGAAAAEQFAEALARLQYLVDQRGQVGLVLGVPGTGKTSLLRSFVAASRRQGLAAAFVVGRHGDESGLVQQLAREWQVPRTRNTSSVDAWHRISERLIELRYEQTTAIVALDDLDSCTAGAKGQAERLLRIAQAHEVPLTIVVSSSSQSATALGGLVDEIELRVDLLPWSEDEMAAHVAQRLFQCGSPTPIFTDEAITALHELSGGIPRKVEQIAQLALLAGAGQQLPEIDAETLVNAYEQLGVTESGVAQLSEQLLERL